MVSGCAVTDAQDNSHTMMAPEKIFGFILNEIINKQGTNEPSSGFTVNELQNRYARGVHAVTEKTISDLQLSQRQIDVGGEELRTL